MRIFNWCATAFGAAAFLQGAAAQSTYTTTIYLQRVEQTTTQSAPAGMIPYKTTSKVLPTGATPTGPASSSVPTAQATNAASVAGIENIGIAAVVGLVGLAVL